MIHLVSCAPATAEFKLFLQAICLQHTYNSPRQNYTHIVFFQDGVYALTDQNILADFNVNIDRILLYALADDIILRIPALAAHTSAIRRIKLLDYSAFTELTATQAPVITW